MYAYCQTKDTIIWKSILAMHHKAVFQLSWFPIKYATLAVSHKNSWHFRIRILKMPFLLFYWNKVKCMEPQDRSCSKWTSKILGLKCDIYVMTDSSTHCKFIWQKLWTEKGLKILKADIQTRYFDLVLVHMNRCNQDWSLLPFYSVSSCTWPRRCAFKISTLLLMIIFPITQSSIQNSIFFPTDFSWNEAGS